MAFVPNGTIKLLAGVPLDNSYTHTVKYASASAQTSAFLAKTKRTYEHCTYIRETNRIRIPDVYDDVVMCNYLMYQNQGYGNNKWFYAFITGVYYVNDHATEIEFELDVMQTWAFDYDILPGFVERNHTATDNYGENLIDEPLTVKNYYCYNEQVDSAFMQWSMMMYAPFDPKNGYQYYGGSSQNGIYSALEETEIGRVTINITNNVPSFTWTISPVSVLQDLVTNHPLLLEQVAAIMMKPYGFVSHPNQQSVVTRPGAGYTYVTPLESYTPRNKKLLTYPYTKLNVSDGGGNSVDYKFELFNVLGTNVQFFLHSDRCPNESITATPMYYNNIDMDITESIVMSSFPMCSWISNAYLNYLANNTTNIATSFISSALSGITAATGVGAGSNIGAVNGAGQVMGGIMPVVNVVGTAYQAFRQGFIAHGNVANSTFFTMGKRRFEYRTLGAKLEELKVIDDFFDMYGYAIHRVQIPNTDVRPYWCYVKMHNAAIKPLGIDGLPASDMRRIETVLNTGVTFWKDMANVGNYALNNTV